MPVSAWFVRSSLRIPHVQSKGCTPMRRWRWVCHPLTSIALSFRPFAIHTCVSCTSLFRRIRRTSCGRSVRAQTIWRAAIFISPTRAATISMRNAYTATGWPNRWARSPRFRRRCARRQHVLASRLSRANGIECTVGWYFASWVEHLSRSWSVALVHTPGARRDALTHRLAAQCDSDTTLAPSLDAAAMQIQALSPDIILYPNSAPTGLPSHSPHNGSAAVQACAWDIP